MENQLTDEDWKLFSSCIYRISLGRTLTNAMRNWLSNATLAASKGELVVSRDPIEISYPACDFTIRSYGKSDEYGHRWIWYKKEEYDGKKN